MKEFLKTGNGESFSTGDIVQFELNEFRSALLEEVKSGSRVSAFFAADNADGQKQLIAVLLDPAQQTLKIGAAPVGDSYEALTPKCKAFHYFEREIMENHGIMPVGHPWLKPVRTTEAEFYRMEGDALNEVAVGPVHAGVIEPGHFRFQCMGEDVYSLEISLGKVIYEFSHKREYIRIVGGCCKNCFGKLFQKGAIILTGYSGIVMNLGM